MKRSSYIYFSYTLTKLLDLDGNVSYIEKKENKICIRIFTTTEISQPVERKFFNSVARTQEISARSAYKRLKEKFSK